MNKRIILVGPSASGKNFIRSKFAEKGFTFDVSYTTRKPREGEVYGVDYNFISESEFTLRISQNAFYEHVQYNGCRYGTGLHEWKNSDIFIMETDGIKHLKPEDRKQSVVIFVNTPLDVRLQRMRSRGWSEEKISERILTDQSKFGTFTDYDFEISSNIHADPFINL
jgi:guanylate kinase